MHILIIPSWYTTRENPQAGIFFKEQAEALAKYGNKVGVIALNEISIRNIWEKREINLQYHRYIEKEVTTYRLQYPYIPKLPRLHRAMRLYIFKKSFYRYIEENGLPDIIHLHSYLYGDLAMWIQRKFGIAYVITEHSTKFARKLLSSQEIRYAREVFKTSSLNMAVSQEFKRLLQKHIGLDFTYLPNMIDIHFFKCSRERHNTFNFINIAFMEKKKHQKMLIEAFTRSFQGDPGISLTIVGDGPQYQELKELIASLDMEDQIMLYGRANREEVKTLLQNADAFVLSSQYETFGVVIIEAMACGLPVISTRCGGPESIITSKELGLLSEIDEEDLSKKLLTLYNTYTDYDPDLIRDHVIEHFSQEVVTLELMRIYHEVLKK